MSDTTLHSGECTICGTFILDDPQALREDGTLICEGCWDALNHEDEDSEDEGEDDTSYDPRYSP